MVVEKAMVAMIDSIEIKRENMGSEKHTCKIWITC